MYDVMYQYHNSYKFVNKLMFNVSHTWEVTVGYSWIETNLSDLDFGRKVHWNDIKVANVKAIQNRPEKKIVFL